MVELENIHSSALEFEPIHRILTGVDPENILKKLAAECGTSPDQENIHKIEWYSGEKSGTVYLDARKSSLAVGVLQPFLDDYLKEHGGEIDYIHGDVVLKELAKKEQSIGFILPAMEKSQLFRGVMENGVFPRKTFSMGHAYDKRYYLEGRRLDK